MIFGGVFADDRASWPLGLALWATSVLVAALFAWKAHASTQAVFQNGTFTEARVVSTRVELGSEDQTLVVVFRVALADDRAGYRTAGEHHAEYSANLNERWIVEPNHYPFLRDAPFPVLVAPNRKFGKLYVNAEEIEVGRV
jgi:hypothetical protein